MAFCTSVKEACARSGPPKASAGVSCNSFPLPESNLREGCSRSPVLSGILPGCVLRHNCVFAPGRNWAWSSSGCSECPDNGLRHFAGNGRAVFYDDDFEILETLPGQALQKLVHLVGAVVYGNDNGISHVSVSFIRLWEMMLQRYVFIW